jgi:glycosyltransferase involved in cell wall biosynthesis
MMFAAPKPKVSVVIPNYNHARFLRQRVDSVLQQTFQDFELILLDDCSTDESRSILSSYARDPRVRIEFNEVNSGSTFKQWNKGVRISQGEYVWIAESDDCADKRLLGSLVSALDREPQAVFAYCRSRRLSESSGFDGFQDPFIPGVDKNRWLADFCVDGREECRNYFVHCNNVANASSVVFRKAVYERVGGADETMRLCGDWKLWASMALRGKVAYLSEALNIHRIHDASVAHRSKQTGLDVRESLQVIRWIFEEAKPERAVIEKVCGAQAARWAPTLLSTRVPASIKSAVLRDVWALDPHPVRSAIRPAVLAVQLKLLRHWREARSAL